MIQFEDIVNVFAPEYKVIKELGKGGMAIVYMAVQKSLNRTVALKVIPKSFSQDNEFRARFKHEALESAKLSHPNIITIYDTGEKYGYQYISMEYLPGLSLQQFIEQNGVFTELNFITVFIQLLDAISYAHSGGIIHRDLKSSNIIFNGNDKPIIMDFGISKSKQSSGLTVKGSFIGTLEYASPEQIESSESIDHRADIYSIGIVGYEMLSGQVPFKGSINTVINKVLNEPPKHLSSIMTLKNTNLSLAINKAIAKHPDDRFSNADEFKQNLSKLKKKRDDNEKNKVGNKYFVLVIVLLAILGGLIVTGYFYKNSIQSKENGNGYNKTENSYKDKITSSNNEFFKKYGIKLIKVRGGRFIMGNEFGDVDESPSHLVKLNDYYITDTEITVGLWNYVMFDANSNDLHSNDNNLPISNISWLDVQEFIEKLKNISKLGFRLPTEQEWEYAAKEGEFSSQKQFQFTYSGGTNPRDVAWFAENSDGKKHQIKKKKQNKLKIFDMSGNVWEYCSDVYSEEKYKNNSIEQDNESLKICIRGGSFLSNKADIRVTNRESIARNIANSQIGFRLVVSRIKQ